MFVFVIIYCLTESQSNAKVNPPNSYSLNIVCEKKHYHYNMNVIYQKLDNINMHIIDAFIFVIMGPLCIASSTFIIFTFIKYK